MTIGGGGFYTLLWKDFRLAYMTIGGPEIVRLPSQRDMTQAAFYDVWNWDIAWPQLPGGQGLAGLQGAVDDGSLVLGKVIKASNGVVKFTKYDLTDVTIQIISEDETVVGGALPRRIQFDSPHALTMPSGGRTLPVKEEVDG
jgi:hypothetical protein